jgi:hypothetical protein
MNPLIEKYEEIYGKKEEEAPVEESKDTIHFGTHLPGGMGNDVITLGTDCHGLGTITCGDTVIPTAQKMPGGGINLTGDYLSVSSCDSFNVLTTSQKTYTLPNQTSAEQGFNKVLNDLSRGKAVVSSINAEIDQSFTGFGGQIRYTVEIVGTYP